LVSAIGSVKPL